MSVSLSSSSSSELLLEIPDVLPNLIDGVEVVAPQTFVNPSPHNNSKLCLVSRSGSAEVDAAVAAATAAFPAWAATPYETRAAYLEKAAQCIEENLKTFAMLEAIDCGKPVTLATNVDIPRTCSNLRFFAGQIRHLHSEAHFMPDNSLNFTVRSPVGVAALITPWNLPAYLLSWKVAPALACGNTVVCKPSEMTPLTAWALGRVFQHIGLPKGVFNIVHGFGAEAGQALTAHPLTPLVSFTGGTVTGRMVAATAAPMFKKLSLELGGKNATVVFADCDWDATVAGAARASFANQGQICLCGSRLFVQRSIADRFIAALKDAASKLVIGEPSNPQVTFGSLTSKVHFDKVHSYWEMAKQDVDEINAKHSTPVAEVWGGGRVAADRLVASSPEAAQTMANDGNYFAPCIITGLPITSRCSVEEIFGPVLVVHVFEDSVADPTIPVPPVSECTRTRITTESELLSAINNTNYGLAGSLWTRDSARIHRITRAWETGMIWCNTWLHRDLRVPFGGWKQSGLCSY